MRMVLALSAVLSAAALAQGADDRIAQARQRWSESPHGPMLERILPPTFEARQLPAPKSRGARLMAQYCVQCHNLPNPAMHEAKKWPTVFERMVVRMRGKGNLGELMKDMMAGVQAPSDEEAKTLLAYLRRNGQRPLDPVEYPEVNQPEGQSFKLACQQCHVLPDPRRHTAAEWPAVVARMEKNMEWMNRVVGNSHPPDEPQLRIEEINAFLVKRARKG
jgi:cytochrome c2